MFVNTNSAEKENKKFLFLSDREMKLLKIQIAVEQDEITPYILHLCGEVARDDCKDCYEGVKEEKDDLDIPHLSICDCITDQFLYG